MLFFAFREEYDKQKKRRREKKEKKKNVKDY
jgi:hypothetical protein